MGHDCGMTTVYSQPEGGGSRAEARQLVRNVDACRYTGGKIALVDVVCSKGSSEVSRG